MSGSLLTRRTRGYTLLEMALALAVVAVLFSISWPVMRRVHADSRLKGAVEEVRGKLAGTRIRAIDSGLVYQFRFEPAGRRFLVAPFEQDTRTIGQQGGNSATVGQPLQKFSGELPESMSFRPTNAEIVVEQVGEEWLSGLAEAADLADVTWSAPVLFYADGSSIDAEFDVVDAREQAIRFSVRDLTGSVTVKQFDEESG
jgi:prepilin-type N-terminal cleavage/methylation domain-containing protein